MKQTIKFNADNGALDQAEARRYEAAFAAIYSALDDAYEKAVKLRNETEKAGLQKTSGQAKRIADIAQAVVTSIAKAKTGNDGAFSGMNNSRFEPSKQPATQSARSLYTRKTLKYMGVKDQPSPEEAIKYIAVKWNKVRGEIIAARQPLEDLVKVLKPLQQSEWARGKPGARSGPMNVLLTDAGNLLGSIERFLRNEVDKDLGAE